MWLLSCLFLVTEFDLFQKHAEELNSRFPDRYKDANHKPEMALALTDFEGLCSFMPFDQIQKYIKGFLLIHQ